MKVHPAFSLLTLLLIVLCAGLSPAPPPLRAISGLLLVGLWGYSLWQAASIRLLPGHALMFLGLSLVQAEIGLLIWFFVPPLYLALDISFRKGWRSLSAGLYAILWLTLFFLVHQLVAVGRGFFGSALWAWSAGLSIFAAAFVTIGALRIRYKG